MLSALFSLKLLKTKENMIYFTNFYFLLELAHDIEWISEAVLDFDLCYFVEADEIRWSLFCHTINLLIHTFIYFDLYLNKKFTFLKELIR